ncbi:tetratricopeptide repeat protein [Thioalkalivibrio sp. ALE14]|uniref:tetratricopeptide repeat protein n=1 Tax=Thioalkalivibrio sp. ALE14 TaxID=1158168 RepID=UPI000371C147|nr:sel1 repeat family protein [Thioalkalivibrio sp. ALE14]
MHWVTLGTAMAVTGLAKRTVWRRVAGHPEWKKNMEEPLQRAQVALEALRHDLLLRVEGEDDLAMVVRADKGDADAMTDLALMLREAANAAAALPWLQAAAETGHPDAMHWIGRALVAGDGIPTDQAAGLDWIRRSAAAGHVISQQQMDAISTR